ncbi:MAG: gliding motility-associated C-terminal domain-containing protein [Bacteroidia bacterium]|nr:gliding motility-associated C-terminal domain-containing protein [Bacteroidia bacterium]
MGKYTWIFAVIFIFFPCIYFSHPTPFSDLNSFNPRAGCFIENKGQWPSKVLFRADIPGGIVWITKDGALFDYYFYIDNKKNKKNDTRNNLIDSIICQGQRIKFEFLGCNKTITTTKNKPKDGVMNFFIGNKKENWATDVGRFEEVTIHNLYRGISLRYYFDKGNLRYDFIIEKGIKPDKIKIRIDGANSSIQDKSLTINSIFGKIVHNELNVYQIGNKSGQIKLNSKWKKINSNIYSFEIEKYNPKLKIVIDPVVFFSTYLGTSKSSPTYTHSEKGIKIKADSKGNSIVVGTTNENKFPEGVQTGTYSAAVPEEEIFITKLNQTGNQLLFSTLIGGETTDIPTDFLLHPRGIFVCGRTLSDQFPITNMTYQNLNNGDFDGFIINISHTGNALVRSTYIGGKLDDDIYCIKYNFKNRKIYIGGSTDSNDFPVKNAYFYQLNGSTDGFISAFNITLDTLYYSTYFGGNESFDEEYISSIEISNDGNIYFTGMTNAQNLPTVNTYGTDFSSIINSDNDIFVGKINFNLNNIFFLGYLGGSEDESFPLIKYSHKRKEYMLLFNTKSNFINSGCNPLKPFSGSYLDDDIYIAKFDSTHHIKHCTYHGSIGGDQLSDFDFDIHGFVYVTGTTKSLNFPPVATFFNQNYASTPDNNISVFITDSILNTVYSESFKYLGNDKGNGIFVGKNSKTIYLTGEINSVNFYTINPYQNTLLSSIDAFVMKFNLNYTQILSCEPTNTVCIGSNFLFSLLPSSTGLYTLKDPNGNIIYSGGTSTFSIPCNSNTPVGTYSLISNNSFGSHTHTFNLYVTPLPSFNSYTLLPNDTVCVGSTVTLSLNNMVAPFYYSVQGIPVNSAFTVNPNTFTVIALYENIDEVCIHTKNDMFIVMPPPATTLATQPGYLEYIPSYSTPLSYQWYHCSNAQAIPNETNTVFYPPFSSSYYLQINSPYCSTTTPCYNIQAIYPYITYTISHITCSDKNNGSIQFQINYNSNIFYFDKIKWSPSDLCPDDDCLELKNLSAGNYTAVIFFKSNSSTYNDYSKTYTFTIFPSTNPCIIKPYSAVVKGGSNAYFHIDFINEFPDNIVQIFSRWGIPIKTIKGYNNTDRKWPENNEYVIPGTYYYVITLDKNSKPIKGWLEVTE